jgi:phospholipid/cholesterol/gamma-HCH transport system substrate-binding protein
MAATVRKDSEFFVTTQGVLGEKYIEIVPGSAASPEWPDGSYIRGHDPARIDLIFSKVDTILERVEGALTPEEGKAIRLADLIASLTSLAQHVDEFLVENRQRLDRVVGNVESTTEEAAQVARYLREGLGSGEDVRLIVTNVQRITSSLARQVDPALVSARKVLGQADEAMGVINGVLKRNEPHVDAAIANLEPISEDARKMMRDAAHVAGSVKTGRGTVGQLIVDQEIYDDLKELLRDLKRHPWKVLWRE